jgi:hypothetical protein
MCQADKGWGGFSMVEYVCCSVGQLQTDCCIVQEQLRPGSLLTASVLGGCVTQVVTVKQHVQVHFL